MHDSIAEVHQTPITIDSLEDALFSTDGLEVLDPGQVLAAVGYDDDSAARAALPGIKRGGVQTAPSGVIQDPAGSAVGASDFAAGGASGAIYSHFNGMSDASDHLKLIDKIAQGASIFNRSAGAGRRVLHTYSPMLHGKASNAADRARALQQLANAYFGAVVAFNKRAPELGTEGHLLNLVPISAKIFAGPFKHERTGWGDDHLDPSYSLCAILLATAELQKQGSDVPSMTLYYYPAGPYGTALDLVNALTPRS